MDVWRITVAALRRWYVLVPLLALTAFAAVTAGNGVRPEYDVAGTIMVVPGHKISETPNPYGDVDDANAALGVVLSSPETRGAIAAQGLNPGYEVAPQTRSTLMTFTVRADSPEAGISTGKAVFARAEDELSSRQTAANIPLSSQYGVAVLQAPSLSATVTTGSLRVMAIVGVLGAGISLLAAVFFDDLVGLIRRRRGKRDDRKRSRRRRKAAARDVPIEADLKRDNPDPYVVSNPVEGAHAKIGGDGSDGVPHTSTDEQSAAEAGDADHPRDQGDESAGEIVGQPVDAEVEAASPGLDLEKVDDVQPGSSVDQSVPDPAAASSAPIDGLGASSSGDADSRVAAGSDL